jgi:hypothetical protein
MSPSQNSFRQLARRGFAGVLFSGLAALALLDPGAAIAQSQSKQIKLSEKQVLGYIASVAEMAKLDQSANPDEPDPQLEAQAAAVAKKNGFASLAEYDEVVYNIYLIYDGIDPATKKFTEPPDRIRQEIAALKADKTISEAEKKQELEELEAALKTAKPIQFRENIELVLKYYDKLTPSQLG